jgi:hypothetical protein
VEAQGLYLFGGSKNCLDYVLELRRKLNDAVHVEI